MARDMTRAELYSHTIDFFLGKIKIRSLFITDENLSIPDVPSQKMLHPDVNVNTYVPITVHRPGSTCHVHCIPLNHTRMDEGHAMAYVGIPSCNSVN